MTTKSHLAIVLIACSTLSAAVAPAAPPSTAFTYQGQLASAGAPANGLFNMTFSLWDASTSGNQLGPTLTFDGAAPNPATITITNGLFTVPLDFGAAPYSGSARWLQISVEGTLLLPRQPLTGAPYSLATRGLTVDPADNVGIGAAPSNKLSVAGSADIAGNLSVGTTSPAGPFDVHVTRNVLDQQQLQSFGQWQLSENWQSFTPGYSGQLTTVDLFLSGPTATGTMNILSGEGSGGAVVATQTVDVTSNATGYWVSVPLFVPPSLVAGQRYTIELLNFAPSGVGWGYIAGVTDPYSGGTANIGIGIPTDFKFQTHMLLAPQPSLFVAPWGNVGIATLAPNNAFSVSGNADFSGSVGIGVQSPAARLEVAGDLRLDDSSSIALYFAGHGENSADTGIGHPSDGVLALISNNADALHIDTHQNIGLGTINPQSRLEISTGSIGTNGQVRLTNTAAPAGFQTGAITQGDDGFLYMTNKLPGFTGRARLDSTGAWTVSSDRRLKTGITTADNILTLAMQLRPVNYKWISEGPSAQPQLGFIAQEVRDLFPQFVVGDDSTGTLTLNYAGLSTVAIAAIQELKHEKDAEIAALHAENAELTARLDRLERALQTIAARK